MKKSAVIIISLFSASACFAGPGCRRYMFEALGDKYSAQKNSVTDTAQACAIIDNAVENYKKPLKME